MIERPLFQQLPHWSQVAVVTRQGTVVGQREHKDWSITLYLLGNDFVEVWERQGLHIVGAFAAAAKPLAILEPYTDTISVQEAFTNS